MAALDNITLEAHEVQDMVSAHDVKSWMKEAFWAWFDANRQMEVLVVRVWIVKKTIRLQDIEFVFEKFFGPNVSPA